MRTSKKPKLNRESLYSSVISSLQTTYNEYKQLMIEPLSNSYIDNNGNLCIADGIDKIYEKAKEVDKEMQRLIMLRNMLRSDASDEEILNELNKQKD